MSRPSIAHQWRDRARCAEYGPTWLEDLDQAAQLEDCGRCPVRQECLAHAILTGATSVVQGAVAIGTRPLKGLVELLEEVGQDAPREVYRRGALVVNPNVCDICRHPRHKDTPHHEFREAVEAEWMARRLGWL